MMSNLQPNQFLLAADNSPNLLPLLRSNPALASSQDEHGYSLLHAAASYNHLDLLRALVNEFNVNVDLKDEDGETALFVAETVDCAKALVEELHASVSIRSDEGLTAREKIAEDEDFPQVAVYLRVKELEAGVPQVNGSGEEASINGVNGIHPPPEGVRVNFGTMNPEEELTGVDLELRRRIDELAAREDFQGEAGQEALHALISGMIADITGEERDVRQRTN